MNMYNQSNILDWKPLSFRELSSCREFQLNKNNNDNNIEQTESEPQSVISEVSSVVIEQELQQLKEEIKAQAYQEGFNLGKEEGFTVGKQTGYEQGYQIGQQEGRDHLELELNEERINASQTITSLLTNFKQSIDDIDDLIVPQLIDLALLAAQKTVGSIPKVKQKQLVSTIRTLIDQCPLLSEPILLHINPDDFNWLEPMLGEEIKQDNWQLIADQDVESGGCKLLTETNEIDASITNHWQIMADSLHGESD